MENYICINNQKIGLSAEQLKQLQAAQGLPGCPWSDIAVADTVKIGGHEMVVLDHAGEATILIRKDLLHDSMEFGENNNYADSDVDAACEAFADEIAAAVGSDNILVHTVDLTSDDGLKDYGTVERRASLLTADQYRRYVAVLDKHKVGKWWWLATAHSTPAHDDDAWVKCVSPSGLIYYFDYFIGSCGVRPFCILKSNIFVYK